MDKNTNQIRVEYSKRFLKQIQKSPIQIQKAFRVRRALFLIDPYHPQLHNHALTGSLQRYRSINITGDWRVLFRMIERKEKAVLFFDSLGTHSELYRK